MMPIPADASREDPLCRHKYEIDPESGYEILSSHYHGEDTVENDPIVRMFLERNPEISLSDAVKYTRSGGPIPYTWHIGDNPSLSLDLDRCFDIAWYHYYSEEKEASGNYQNNDNVMAAITGEEPPLCENHNGQKYPESYLGEEQVRNDLLVKGFLAANPDISLSQHDEEHVTVNHNLYAPYRWDLGGRAESYLRIELDKCFNVAYFGYAERYGNDPDKINSMQGRYEENYHAVLQAITGKPFTPYVQATFYEIPIRDVQCNGEENRLYIRDDAKPVCLKPYTYENLLQRGYNLEKVQQVDLEVNPIS